MKMSPGKWLLLNSAWYLIAGMICVFWFHLKSDDLTVVYIQIAWLFITSLPLYIPPLSRWVGVPLFWKL